jgi:hypothetical protein
MAPLDMSERAPSQSGEADLGLWLSRRTTWGGSTCPAGERSTASARPLSRARPVRAWPLAGAIRLHRERLQFLQFLDNVVRVVDRKLRNDPTSEVNQGNKERRSDGVRIR